MRPPGASGGVSPRTERWLVGRQDASRSVSLVGSGRQEETSLRTKSGLLEFSRYSTRPEVALADRRPASVLALRVTLGVQPR